MERSAFSICPAFRKLAHPFWGVLKQFSRQDLMPPCSIKEIAQNALLMRGMVSGIRGGSFRKGVPIKAVIRGHLATLSVRVYMPNRIHATHNKW